MRCETIVVEERFVRCSEIHVKIFLSEPGHFITVIGVSNASAMYRIGGANHYQRLLIPKYAIILRTTTGPTHGAPCSIVTMCGKRQLVGVSDRTPGRITTTCLTTHFPRTSVQHRIPFKRSHLSFYLRRGNDIQCIRIGKYALRISSIKCFPSTPARQKIGRLRRLVGTIRTNRRTTILFVIRVRKVVTLHPGSTARPTFNRTLHYTTTTNIRI